MSLELKNLSYRYEGSPQYAVENINLSIERGQVLAIAGKNGSGKTTLAKLIAGLLKPASGKIYLDGVNLERLNSRAIAGKIGLVFQNPLHQLFCESVAWEIAFGLKNLSLPEREIELKVSDALSRYELLGYRDKHPLALSEGQKKRLALASILAMDPDFLILDEPTLGQDLKQIQKLKALFRELTARGKGIIIISQDMEFLSETAHRITVMLDGRIIADHDAKKILFNEALLKQCGLSTPAIPKLVHLLMLDPALSEEEILSTLKEKGRVKNVS